MFVAHRYWPEEGPVALSVMATSDTRERAQAKCQEWVDDLAENQKGILASLARLSDAVTDLADSIHGRIIEEPSPRDREDQLCLAFVTDDE